MIGDIMQPTHLVFVLLVALLVLGPKRLPEVGRQLGNGLRDFRSAISGERSEPHDEVASADSGRVSPDRGTEYSQPATEPEFAQDTVTTPGDHLFAHEASDDVPAAEHESVHDVPTAVSDGHVSQETASPVDKHQLAYETSEPADKRSDSLS
jgi:sec-independent protein translocase protein TatA